MEKNLLNDVEAPAHKRSIRDIPIPNNRSEENIPPKTSTSEINLRRETPSREDADDFSEENTSGGEFPIKNEKKPRKKVSKKLLTILGSIVVILILVISLMNAFAKVKINVVSKRSEASLEDMELRLTPIDEVQNETQLGYRDLDFGKTSDLSVPAEEEELVQEKASGTVTVYNLYSKKDQTWIKNTRFQSENGLVYRTPVGVTIPGYTENGEEKTPGKIEVEIYADEIGEEYNLSSGSTFTIPAFEGQESYDLFWAEADTNIEGGFDGVRKIVAAEDLGLASSQLQEDLKKALQAEINNHIPDNLIALYSDDSYSFDPIKQEDSDDGTASLSLTGNISVMVIDKGDLASVIAQNKLSDYRINEEIEIDNLQSLNVGITKDSDRIFVKVSGNAEFVWEIDDSRLAKDLVGKEASEIREILTDYRGVTSVTTEFSPFWKKNFPEEVDRIIINKI